MPLLFPLLCFLLLGLPGCQGPKALSPDGENFLGPQAEGARGNKRVLVVAARFPGVKPTVSLERIKRKAVKGLGRYVKEQSYGLTRVTADFRGGVMLPDPISTYKVSPYNFRVDRTRVRKLIEDVLTALEGQVDFSAYDHLFIIPRARTQAGKGYGMICYCANPGMLSGVRKNLEYVRVASENNQEFTGGIFVGAENAHLGMYAHDFFHALGGIDGKRRFVP